MAFLPFTNCVSVHCIRFMLDDLEFISVAFCEGTEGDVGDWSKYVR